MIEDILAILSDGEWHDTKEICERLYSLDPIRYRTTSRYHIAPRINTLIGQDYPIIKDYNRVKGIVHMRYRMLIRWRCR